MVELMSESNIVGEANAARRLTRERRENGRRPRCDEVQIDLKDLNIRDWQSKLKTGARGAI